ncbi:MAG: type secretion system secreted protein VgrG [Pyrinomonadaceae bacterium]|nr:type secretion system secreted protein VgrG [Pyrinomonadaceae bacterium]
MRVIQTPSTLSSLLLVSLFVLLFVLSTTAAAQTVPPLGAAESFAALAGTAITATGPAVISGNVGVSPGSAVTGFPPAMVVNGQIYTGAGSLAGPAQSSALDAYNNLKGQACLPANNLSGKILGQTPGFLTLNPGVYCFDTSAQLNATLTLNDGGDPNAVFIFQIGTTLTTASSSQVLMSSGGRGTNVYWQVGSSATIGTSTNFRGNIIANTSITLTTSATTTGRVFALNGAATIDSTTVNAVPTGIQFNAASYPVGEGDKQVDLTVTRSGDTTAAASVDFATSDTAGALNCNVLGGAASSRCDYEIRLSTIRFAAGETTKTISVFIVDDTYLEGAENFTVSLSNAVGGAVGSQGTATVTIADNEMVAGVNPIDTAGFFVRLHYLDFLNREPDTSGLAFWTNEITSCVSPQCVADKRVNVSAAFYLSIEFQQTGYLVERLYKTAYGDGTGASTLGNAHQISVPVVRLLEFLRDTQQIGAGVIIGQAGATQLLETNTQTLIAEFVARSRFNTAFPSSMTAAQFVDALNMNAGNPLSTAERNQLVTDLSTAAKTRAQVLRSVAEDSDLNSAEFNRAFVLMQYFGYMRRNPNDAQDSDYTGYDFWLTKLNQFTQPGDDVLVRVQKAEMVKAFIISAEYRQRFGQ